LNDLAQRRKGRKEIESSSVGDQNLCALCAWARIRFPDAVDHLKTLATLVESALI
jgi:hypothetical protein